VNVCHKFRKKNSVYESLGKMVRKPNYDGLTERMCTILIFHFFSSFVEMYIAREHLNRLAV